MFLYSIYNNIYYINLHKKPIASSYLLIIVRTVRSIGPRSTYRCININV